MATITDKDVYGARPAHGSQGSLPRTQQASGTSGLPDQKPALFWLGMVGFLILLRVLWEMSE